MLDAPEDLTAEHVSSSLLVHWGIEAVEVTYVAQGHGSHNWMVATTDGRKWFVKADRAGENSDFFRTGYLAAAALRDRGLDFVHAAVADLSGEVRRQISPAWDMGVFPFLEGRNPAFFSTERAQIAEMLGRLHALTPIPEVVPVWEPGYYQPELRQLLADRLDQPWTLGPYGEVARSLLARSESEIHALMALHDGLAEQLVASDSPWVATHGEPHAGNTFVDTGGRMHLIDCDAPMVAPRERDLRLLLQGGHRRPLGLDNTDVLAAYRSSAGPVEPRPFALELFRAEWHLIEISRYATLFSGRHLETADMAGRWRTLNEYLPTRRNWPDLRV